MTAQRLLNVSACPTFTAAGGALPAVLRWVCSSPDALPVRRFPPLRFSRRCIYRNGAKFFCFFVFSLLTLYKSIKKGGDKVKKKKKKPTKSRVDVRTIVITAIVDFLVGLALLIIDKLT